MQKPTQSLKAKTNKQLDKGDKVSLYQQTGFTVENLMKDMRYRLSHTLAGAGLEQTEYARRIIQAAPSAKPTRKDTHSSYRIIS